MLKYFIFWEVLEVFFFTFENIYRLHLKQCIKLYKTVPSVQTYKKIKYQRKMAKKKGQDEKTELE